MSHCDRMVDVGRRKFMSGAGLAAAGVAVTSIAPTTAKAAPAAARVDYPSNRLANIADLKANEPMNVAYPDDSAPGRPVEARQKGAGRRRRRWRRGRFSTTCPHKGFPLNYNAADRTMNCPGHYSRFDCEAGGQQVWGQATQNLPQYVLRVDGKGDIYAEGVDELLYGRLSNVL